jgi:hypothetical protein
MALKTPPYYSSVYGTKGEFLPKFSFFCGDKNSFLANYSGIPFHVTVVPQKKRSFFNMKKS